MHKKINSGRGSPQDCLEYKNLRSVIKFQTEHELCNYNESIEANINDNPTNFWHFFRSKKSTGGIPGEVTDGQRTFVGSQAVSDAFAQFFSSVFTQSNIPSESWNYGTFKFSYINEDQVKNSIKKLKPKKATGNDNIPAYIIKGCADLLAEPLARIFNIAIKNKQFPNELKTAVITPIYKKKTEI